MAYKAKSFITVRGLYFAVFLDEGRAAAEAAVIGYGGRFGDARVKEGLEVRDGRPLFPSAFLDPPFAVVFGTAFRRCHKPWCILADTRKGSSVFADRGCPSFFGSAVNSGEDGGPEAQ
jgi:hypothetical protein